MKNMLLLEHEDFSEIILEEATPYTASNIKILGLKSKNNRTYLKEAIQQALPMYEGAPVYLDHNDKLKYENNVGYITAPTLKEDGLYGAIQLKPSHYLVESILYDIRNKTPRIGLSHQIEGVENKGVVSKIERVISVDIVANPATVKNFRESQDSVQADSDIKRLLEEVLEAIKVGNSKIQEDKIEELEAKVKALDEQLAKLNSPKPIARGPAPIQVNQNNQFDIKKMVHQLRKGWC